MHKNTKVLFFGRKNCLYSKRMIKELRKLFNKISIVLSNKPNEKISKKILRWKGEYLTFESQFYCFGTIKEIYHLNYENLINNQRAEIKKILEFCSLPWENKCMDFAKTKRIVRTSSHSQVRKKMYQDSIEKWRNYKKFLNKYLKKLNTKY